MTLLDATYDSVVLSTACPEFVIKTVERDLLGSRRDAVVDVPGLAGPWVFPEEPGMRRILIGGAVLVDDMDDRLAKVELLANWADKRGPKRLIFSDQPDRFWDAWLATAPAVVGDEYAAETALEFSAYPYAQAVTASTQVLSLTGGSPKSGSFTASDLIPALPVVEIQPTNGTITSFTWTLNGAAMSHIGTVASGSTVTLSSLSSTITTGVNTDVNLTGAFVIGNVSMANANGEFGRIVSGSNTWGLSWTGTATTATVTLTWRRRYR